MNADRVDCWLVPHCLCSVLSYAPKLAGVYMLVGVYVFEDVYKNGSRVKSWKARIPFQVAAHRAVAQDIGDKGLLDAFPRPVIPQHFLFLTSLATYECGRRIRLASTSDEFDGIDQDQGRSS